MKKSILLSATLALLTAQASQAQQGTEIVVQPESIPAEYQRQGVDENGNPVTVVALPVEVKPAGAPGEYELTVIDPQTASYGGIDSIAEVQPMFPVVRVTTGQILSAQFGVIIGTTHCGTSFLSCSIDGVVLEAEPGVGGMKLSAGLGSYGLAGAEIKGSALYKWAPVGMGEAGNTYIGPELELRMLLFDFTIGYLKNTVTQDGIVNIGLGMIPMF